MTRTYTENRGRERAKKQLEISRRDVSFQFLLLSNSSLACEAHSGHGEQTPTDSSTTMETGCGN